MNFFKLYIGDYQRDTAHLSIAEHGAYMLMLQHYYATERPLPSGKALHRMLRAHEAEEREAVDSVVKQFWTSTEDGLINKRAGVEIRKAEAQAEANAKVTRDRIAKRNVQRTRNESSDESLNESCNESKRDRSTIDQPNQTPDTRHQNHSQSQELQSAFAIANVSPADAVDLLGDREAKDEAKPEIGKPCPHEDIIAAYHEILPELDRVRAWHEQRQRWLRSRWREDPERQSLDWWRNFFGYVRESDFLMGRAAPDRHTGRAFMADLEWLVRPTNFAKVLEGRYENRGAA